MCSSHIRAAILILLKVYMKGHDSFRFDSRHHFHFLRIALHVGFKSTKQIAALVQLERTTGFYPVCWGFEFSMRHQCRCSRSWKQATVSKTVGVSPCGFDTRHRYQIIFILMDYLYCKFLFRMELIWMKFE